MKLIRSKHIIVITAFIMVFSSSNVASAQVKGVDTLVSIDSNLMIYEFNDNSNSNQVEKLDDNLIYDTRNNTYYTKLDNDLYSKAEKYDINENNINEIENINGLRSETKQIVLDIFSNAEKNNISLEGDTVTIYTPVSNVESINAPDTENILSSENKVAAMKASYPVSNEQIRYTGIANEQIIASGSNAFSEYGSSLLNNCANLTTEAIVSKIFPPAGCVSTVMDLFPSYYNEIRTYKNWTLGVKLSEEKVVQLSWVNVAGNIYLGAQTQFATIRYTSIGQQQFRLPVVDTSGFIYYKTPNYQSPETIARKYFNDTYVERLDSYRIKNTWIDSLF